MSCIYTVCSYLFLRRQKPVDRRLSDLLGLGLESGLDIGLEAIAVNEFITL